MFSSYWFGQVTFCGTLYSIEQSQAHLLVPIKLSKQVKMCQSVQNLRAEIELYAMFLDCPL